jgi:sec-independent protein translocase protein TatA
MCHLFGYFGMPGPLEMFIVAVIVLLLFGNRLPGVMRSLGRGIVEFKKGVSGIEEEVEEAVHKREIKEDKKEEQTAGK